MSEAFSVLKLGPAPSKMEPRRPPYSKRRRVGQYVKGETTDNPYFADWELMPTEDSQVLVPPLKEGEEESDLETDLDDDLEDPLPPPKEREELVEMTDDKKREDGSVKGSRKLEEGSEADKKPK